ncbi:MAG TPA: hypothetical protein VJ044_01045 [Candidatus Hodarchaeales archaeon]|nr:hypothetical protein [Candidatus Hodarchaeales archaeon]
MKTTLTIVLRKARQSKKIGNFATISATLATVVTKKCEEYFTMGMHGVNLFVAGLGPALQTFGQFSQVIDDDNRKIGVEELARFVQENVCKFLQNKLSHQADTSENSYDRKLDESFVKTTCIANRKRTKNQKY